MFVVIENVDFAISTFCNHTVIFTELNTISLQEFPSNKSGKNLNIIVQSAPHYKKIGTMLLNDKNGAIVEGIAMRCTPESIMTEIYEKWLQNNASWEDLIQCLKKCGLNVIAQDIEGGLGNVSGISESVLFLWNLH